MCKTNVDNLVKTDTNQIQQKKKENVKLRPGLWQMLNTPIVRFVPILFNSSHCSPYS